MTKIKGVMEECERLREMTSYFVLDSPLECQVKINPDIGPYNFAVVYAGLG